NKGQGSLTVRGVNSAISLPSKLNVEQMSVGNYGPGSMLIEGHAEVSSQAAFIGSPSPLAPSEVSIIGSRALWKVDVRLEVGSVDLGNFPSQSIVTLGGGTLSADSVVVGQGGVIRGSGTLAVAPANRFTNANGTISPGLSPGTITINGNYEQGSGGR